jgi:micrococcal nuclease
MAGLRMPMLGLAVVGAGVLGGVAVLALAASVVDGTRVWDVYDGDSLRITDRAGRCCERIRLAGIDAPERGWRAECETEEATLRVRALAEASRATAIYYLDRGLVSVDRLPAAEQLDPYGRTLADVRVADGDLGELLIAAGVAVPWAGRRHDWCAQ